MSTTKMVTKKKKPKGVFTGKSRFQPLFRKIIRLFVKIFWKTEFKGLENIPKSGPAILCPNQLSFFDLVLLMASPGRNIYIIGKIEFMDSWKTKYLFPAFGMITVNRSGGSYADETFEACKKVLHRGDLILIFPEGTRSPDGRLYRGHTGAARLATWVGCPIIPVGIFGTNIIQPPGAPFPKIGKKAKLVFGEPINVSSSAPSQKKDDPIHWRQITDTMMQKIANITGQEYCNEYATKTRAEYKKAFENS